MPASASRDPDVADFPLIEFVQWWLHEVCEPNKATTKRAPGYRPADGNRPNKAEVQRKLVYHRVADTH